MTYYLTKKQIVDLNRKIVGENEHGILQPSNLNAAVSMPSKVVYNTEVCPTLIDKCYAMILELAQGHPFQEGNKRTAFAATKMFLLFNKHKFKSDDTLKEFINCLCDEDPPESEDVIKKYKDDIIALDEGELQSMLENLPPSQ